MDRSVLLPTGISILAYLDQRHTKTLKVTVC